MSEKFYILRFKKCIFDMPSIVYNRYLYWIYSSQFMLDLFRRASK